MDLSVAQPLSEIARLTGTRIIGDHHIIVSSINEIHRVKHGSLTFVDAEKYYDMALYSAASVILINKEVECPPGKALLVCDNPFGAYNALALHFKPFAYMNATISHTATIGEGTIIEPNAVIGNHVTIGKNCYIRANATICDDTVIGDEVIIQPNTVVGGDAFYYHKDNSEWTKWHSIGKVIIHDRVEIGAGCTIDRGVSDNTIIGEGTKIDNMVHIGHGVQIGKNCLIAAQVGIAGKSIIQDNVTLYGQVGVSKLVVIGEGAVVFAQSGVSKSLQGGKKFFGSPAGEINQKYREIASLRRLPYYLAEVDRRIGQKPVEPEIGEMMGQEFQSE